MDDVWIGLEFQILPVVPTISSYISHFSRMPGISLIVPAASGI